MMKQFVTWMRAEAQQDGKGRIARWIGRNWAHLSYAVKVEPTWLELNSLPIPIADLPKAFHGYRIVQMSDFHGGGKVAGSYLDQAVDLAQAQNPDLIVLTGDFIHKGFNHVEQVARVVGRLRCPDGVFAVLGNHDYSVRNALGVRRHQHLHSAITKALTDQGIRVLHNESQIITRGEQTFYLAGVADLWSRSCDPHRALAHLAPNVPRVVLAHNPCTIDSLDGLRCDLMLSGHTHGGQVKVPGLGPLALGPKGRRYAAGLYQQGHSILYVNKGVGFGWRMRYGVRPEVTVLTLQPRNGDH